MTEINDIRSLSNEELKNKFNQCDIYGFDGEFGCIQGLYQSVEFSPRGLGLLSGGLSGVVFVGLTSDGQRVEAYSLGVRVQTHNQ